MKFNDKLLVKQALEGAYGDDVLFKVRSWLIQKLLNGERILLSSQDLIALYDTFDDDFAEAFVENPNWKLLWIILDRYKDDHDLMLPRMVVCLIARTTDEEQTKKLQNWVCLSVSNQKMIEVILLKAKTTPQILDWSLVFLTKFTTFKNATMLIEIVKDIAIEHPDYMEKAVLLIEYIGRHRRFLYGMNLVMATKALVIIFEKAKVNQTRKQYLLSKIIEFTNQMEPLELRVFMKHCHKLPLVTRMTLYTMDLKNMTEIVECQDVFEKVHDIYYHGMKRHYQSNAVIKAWQKFIDEMVMIVPEHTYDIFLGLNDDLSQYICQKEWQIALMDWNPGVNFQNYSEELQELTLDTLRLANLTGLFRPRAFLTALNICVFDESGKYQEKWLKKYVEKMPQSNIQDGEWQDNLLQLCRHFEMLYRYRIEFQHKNADFIAKYAKLFVRYVMANYNLGDSQIQSLETLCSRVHLDFDVRAESDKMKQRVAHRKKAKAQEVGYLLELIKD